MADKRIGMKGDGLNYVFTPGKKGSLIGRKLGGVKTGMTLPPTPKVRAKVVGPKKGLEGAFQPIKVGGVRG